MGQRPYSLWKLGDRRQAAKVTLPSGATVRQTQATWPPSWLCGQNPVVLAACKPWKTAFGPNPSILEYPRILIKS